MKIQEINGNMAWAIICHNATVNRVFKSKTGKKYQLNLKNDILYYCTESRNNGLDEQISKYEFIKAFESIKSLEVVNTNTIKTLIPNTIYRKRTPFIGLLYSASIIK